MVYCVLSWTYWRAVLLSSFCLLVVWGLLLALPGPETANAAEPDARDVLKKGSIELGFMSGYWQATTVIGDARSSNRSAIFFLPQAGMVLHDPFEAGFFSGNFTVLVEPLAAHFFEPFSASAFGGSVVAKYNFVSFGRWVPFFDVGLGMMWTDLAPRIPEQSTQFNFLVEVGPGVQYFLTRATALTLGVRWHHISNADLGDRNTGINAGLFYGGVSFYLAD